MMFVFPILNHSSCDMNFKSTYQRISLTLVPFSLLIQCFKLCTVCLHLQATSQQLLAEVLKELGKKTGASSCW